MKKEALEEFNPWWFTGEVPEDTLEEYRRGQFSEVIKRLTRKQIIAVTGLRRVGKTTLIYQVVQYLLDKNIEPTNILYFSFDETVKGLDDLMNTYRENQGKDFRKNKVYIFLDEIQKLENWQNQLKKYHDSYPKIGFIISGSESLFIKTKSIETLAGRLYELQMPTLSFKEFLEIQNIDVDKTPILKIKTLFREYIEKGGLPEIVYENDKNEIKRYAKSSVIDKILFKDILVLTGIKDPEVLRVILETISANPGMQLEYQSLAQQLDRDRRTISDYITWLREAFLIKTLENYRKGRLATMKKNKRVYITDNGVIVAFRQNIDEAFFGRLVENAVINALNARFFWKNRHDVDAVIDCIPVEVKFKNKILNNELRGVREFMRKFKIRKGVVVTKDDDKKITVSEGKIFFIPAWKLLLKPNLKNLIQP